MKAGTPKENLLLINQTYSLNTHFSVYEKMKHMSVIGINHFKY